MDKVSIELWGMILYEPETFVSDIFLTVVCLLFRRSMLQTSHSDFSRQFANFFGMMSLGTLMGGISHLLGYYLSHNWIHVAGWIFSSTGLYYFQRGSAFDFPKSRVWLNKVFLAQLIVSISIYVGYQAFGDFEVDHTRVGVPGFMAVSASIGVALLVFIMPLNLVKFFRDKENGSGIVVMGIILSATAGIVHARGWALSQYFNHNVIAHIILALCYYLYVMGMKIKVLSYENQIQQA